MSKFKGFVIDFGTAAESMRWSGIPLNPVTVWKPNKIPQEIKYHAKSIIGYDSDDGEPYWIKHKDHGALMAGWKLSKADKDELLLMLLKAEVVSWPS